MAYPFQDIEKKWQDTWEKDGTYHASDVAGAVDQKFYGLVEFPYPSGDGLHVGHPRSYSAIDIVTRKKRMEGKNVLYPIGWDAFGLPTENFAIKNNIKPADATKANVANFTRQIKSLGIGFDWSREINTTDPAYYKWTQWMFLQFYHSYFDEVEGRAKPMDEMAIPAAVQEQGESVVRAYKKDRRMAYKGESVIHWCPKCKIGLANEEAQGGVCDRCGGPVEERLKKQWMIRISKYADRLIDDLADVDYLEKIRQQQIHWIGRSTGAFIDFEVVNAKGSAPEKIRVFTTRPDTLFGATYAVLAPEHPFVKKAMDKGMIQNGDAVKGYVQQTIDMTDLERQEKTEKTGIALEGVHVINPATGREIPIWISDYVLGSYGTGAIMAVPAHDERDYEFAQKFNLPVIEVVGSTDDSEKILPFTEEGTVMNSGLFDGLSTKDAKEKIINWLEAEKIGKYAKTYRLRDWVFSRQRYWGEPIPIVHCPTCETVALPESELPLTLPEVDSYQPTDTGESPLSSIRSWVETTCPHCGGPAERETDTMPNWAGSSWYFMRYCDPHNEHAFAAPEKLRYWMPVNLYNGGMEHTTLHLLYSRFWYKVMWDLGHVPRECGSEPYAKRRSHAMILGDGGVKMSKSKGNVINPDEIVQQYGADIFRAYEMFMGPYDADAPWDTKSIEGVKRFLDKIWRTVEEYQQKPATSLPEDAETLLHQTIKKVGEDIESLKFNTAISALMILVNKLAESGMTSDVCRILAKLLAPFTPHIAEEIWRVVLGESSSIHRSSWPSYDLNKMRASTFELVIQVNGKVRDRMTVSSDISDDEAKKQALASANVQAFLMGKEPKQVIVVKGRLVSIAV